MQQVHINIQMYINSIIVAGPVKKKYTVITLISSSKALRLLKIYYFGSNCTWLYIRMYIHRILFCNLQYCYDTIKFHCCIVTYVDE